MAALDLSEYRGDVDTPEVEALKEKVREVATRYAKQYKWCSVVQKALAECGITDLDSTVKVTVTTKQGFVFDVKPKISDLLDKTEQEQKAALAEAIGEIGITAGTSVVSAAKMKIAASAITEMVLHPKPEVPDPASGGLWMYTTSSGRVRHRLRDASSTYDLTAEDQVHTIRNAGSSYYTACGDWQYETPSFTSPRGEDRNCTKCERKDLNLLPEGYMISARNGRASRPADAI